MRHLAPRLAAFAAAAAIMTCMCCELHRRPARTHAARGPGFGEGAARCLSFLPTRGSRERSRRDDDVRRRCPELFSSSPRPAEPVPPVEGFRGFAVAFSDARPPPTSAHRDVDDADLVRRAPRVPPGSRSAAADDDATDGRQRVMLTVKESDLHCFATSIYRCCLQVIVRRVTSQ